MPLEDNKSNGKEGEVCQDADEAGILNHEVMIAEFSRDAALAEWIVSNL